MEANELLMTGDFLRYKQNYPHTPLGGKIVKVYGIRGRLDVITVDDGNSHESVHPGWFEPISLTPEILKKNGFEKRFNYQWVYRDKGCKIVISIAPQIKIEGEILEEPPCTIMLEGALFNIDITSDCYVHILQHALRLCGIEKEITI